MNRRGFSTWCTGSYTRKKSRTNNQHRIIYTTIIYNHWDEIFILIYVKSK